MVIFPTLHQTFLSTWACICISSNTYWRIEGPTQWGGFMKRSSKWCALRLGGQGKTSMKGNARREKKKKRLKIVYAGVVQDWEKVGDKNCPSLQVCVPSPPPPRTPIVWYPSRLKAFWVRDCLLYFVLCIELLSTPTVQKIRQQKLMDTWQSWKSGPCETLGKLKTAS